jgi:predicted amidohydrolase YtcJ
MKVVILLCLSFLMITCEQRADKADFIFKNGIIYTVNESQPHAEAVAVSNGKILFAGNNSDVLSYGGSQTKVIDLKGNTMTPGFIDGHAHFMGLGISRLDLDLTEVRSFEELIGKVKDRIVTAAPGEWIIGRGWHQDKWDSISKPIVKGFPTHHGLSAISPDNPVYLTHASGHLSIANAKAMEFAGIQSKLDFDEGGEVFKDERGDPTGIFNETAQGLISSFIPDDDPARLQQAFEMANRECLINGITSFHDAGVDEQVIDLYRKNIESGNLKVRIYAMLSGSDNELLDRYFKSGPVIGFGNNFLTIRSIKLYGDGALGSRGAWLLEEYSDMHGVYGHSTTPVPDILEVSKKALQTGFQICTHAIGDRANQEVLNQYELAFLETGKNSVASRFRIEHAQHLHPDDIPRFSALGVLPAMQAIHMSSDRPWAIDRLGEKRIVEGAYVWQDLLKSGAKIINGTDAPVEPIDPLACFYASVSRKTLKGQPPGGFEPAQKMSRIQALKSYTIDAAYGAFEEDIKGSIEVGKFADFAIFNKDIMQIAEEEILNTKVVMTVVNGEIVYSDGTILDVP